MTWLVVQRKVLVEQPRRVPVEQRKEQRRKDVRNNMLLSGLRIKPLEVKAIQFKDDPDTLVDISNFIDNQDTRVDYHDEGCPLIILETPFGVMKARVGDFIVKVDGEFYPCRKEDFNTFFEK